MAYKVNENSISVNKNLPNKLLSCLYSQRKTGKFCDIILNIGGVKYFVHSCVLASFSPYFHDMLLSPSSEILYVPRSLELNKSSHYNETMSKDILECWSLRNPLQLILPFAETEHDRKEMDCPDCASKVLDFMYLGKIQMQKEHVEHVKLLSTVLKITELLLICEKFCSKQRSCTKRKSDFDHTEFVNKKQKAIKCESSVVNENLVKSGEDGSCTQNEAGVSISESNTIHTIEKLNKPDIDKSNLPETPLCESDKPPTNDTVEKTADRFICSVCRLKFSSVILLRQHRETHRSRLHTCYACRFSSHKAFDLIKHLLEADHQETVCSLCLFVGETSGKLKEHLKMHNHPKPFFCSICNVRFHNRAALNTHTPKHSTEMPFSCNVCSRAFKWKQGLQSHMIVHTPEKKHLCPECGFSTAHQSTFRAHALVHTSNILKCQHAGCNFKTVRKHNFQVHLKTHTKEKPYQCEVCGQSYSQAKNLRRHAVKHDAVAEEFIEHCPLCLYQTMRVDKLKMHFRKHHPEGDETLLNLQRRKRRMLSLPKNIASTQKPENIVKTSAPPPDKPDQSVNKQNSYIVMNNPQLSQASAPLILKTLNTKLSKRKSKQKSVSLPADPIVRNEEMMIVLDTMNVRALLVPTSQPFVMQAPEQSSTEVENHLNELLLKTDNSFNTCINPKLLFIDETKESILSIDALSMNTRYEDTYNGAEIPQSILDETSVFGNNLINEQIHKEEPSLDLINNNVIHELLFPETSALDDTTNMLDILPKDVVLDRSKDQMLLCYETISNDADNVLHKSLNKGCSNQALQSFQSFESILESL